MTRVRYFLRVDPPPEEGAPRRVPPDVRERVLEGLRRRFDPKPRGYWEAIDVTSVNTRLLPEGFDESIRRFTDVSARSLTRSNPLGSSTTF
jgi:hypothetical protein